MESRDNYGLILRHLRVHGGLSVRKFAKKIGRGVGWISEIENNKGTARLTDVEFERIIELLDGTEQKEIPNPKSRRVTTANFRKLFLKMRSATAEGEALPKIL